MDIEYFQKIYQNALNEINAKSFDKDSIRGYLRHLPIEGKHSGWPKEVYEVSNKCLHAMYDYSREMKYIDDDLSYEDFVQRKWEV